MRVVRYPLCGYLTTKGVFFLLDFSRLPCAFFNALQMCIRDRDWILVRNLYNGMPEHGDIIVLKKESFLDQPIVKRVIATRCV